MTGRSRGWIGAEGRFVVSAALLCTAVLSVLAQPGYWEKAVVVAPALTVDLVLGLPALGYLFMVRGARAGNGFLVALLVVGSSLARWWIPRAHQDASTTLRLVLVVAELGLTTYLVFRLGRLTSRFRDFERQGMRGTVAMRRAFADVFGPRLGGGLFSELAALWFATVGARATPTAPAGKHVFTVHRRNGYPAVLGVILLLVVVEAVVAHILLDLWSARAAWVSTLLGLYSGLWLLGDYRAARATPVTAGEDGLDVSIGLRWHVSVRWTDVVAVHDRAPASDAVRLAMLGAPDLWVELHEPAHVQGPFGIVRTGRFLGLGVDDARALRAVLDAHVGNLTPAEG